jgi:hypothetical protein
MPPSGRRDALGATAISSDAGDIRSEEVDAVPIEVAACSVVVLGGAWIGVSGEDLRVTERDASVEGRW